ARHPIRLRLALRRQHTGRVMNPHDFSAEHAAAVPEIAALIARRLLLGIDAVRLADRPVTSLRHRGWRPKPRPQHLQRRRAGDPPSAEWSKVHDRSHNRTESTAEAAQRRPAWPPTSNATAPSAPNADTTSTPRVMKSAVKTRRAHERHRP